MKRMKAGVAGLVVSLVMVCMLNAHAENAPGITRIYPTLGPVGQWVYVTGSNLVKNGTTVAVGGLTNISSLVYAGTQLGFRVPAGATGSTHVVVTTTNGTAISAAWYTVGIPTNPPSVSSISPTLGPTGQWVYVSGVNFVFGQTTAAVGGVSNISSTVYGPDKLGFTVPNGASGMTYIVVTTPFGTAQSVQRYQVGIPTNPPTVSQVDEYEGFDWVYVAGRNFVNGQTSVRVGPSYQTSGLVYRPESLGFTPPTNWYDLNILVVTTPFGAATQMLQSASPPIPVRSPTQQGKTYQIQSTTDLLGTWKDVGEPVSGNGDELLRELRARDNVHFWRII
jgi:hypothetical protein